MPVIGIGVDVCAVDRMTTMLARTPAAAQRLFTEGELAYADRGKAMRASRLAARFAAKEAVVKALGGTVTGMDWHDVEVVADGGSPRLVLARAAAERSAVLGVHRWHLSLTHDGGFAVAMVVAES